LKLKFVAENVPIVLPKKLFPPNIFSLFVLFTVGSKMNLSNKKHNKNHMSLMKWTLVALTFSFFTNVTQAQEGDEEVSPAVTPAFESPQNGYISDDLFIYMHAGPGTNYRILGTINAGDAIKVTGKSEKGYSEIIDSKNRKTWVENKYVSLKSSIRVAMKTLQSELTQSKKFLNQNDGQVNELKSELDSTQAKNKELVTKLEAVNKTLAQTQSKVKDQDTNIKKQWFFNGAIVLALGLLLGLLLPKFFSPKRSGMNSWS
jgi:SH3 domain protein